jgi:NAD(P)-dependent dehydrogenase (short-subunit alcohol dehydrogenase family)/acyl carrier protein
MLGYLGQPELLSHTGNTPRLLVGGSIDTRNLSTTTTGNTAGSNDEIDNKLPDIAGLSTEQIHDLILAVVSEKTGYPIDILDFDANLEADLSIDSIKKMEIVGGLREYATFPGDEDDMADSFEKLISIKSLRELLKWVDSLKENTSRESASTGDMKFEGAHAVLDTPSPSESLDDMPINRMVFIERPAPSHTTDEELLKGARFAITDEGTGLAVAVAKALKAQGAEATLITSSTTELSMFDGLIVINAAASAKHCTMSELFTLLKRTDWENLRWVYTFDDGLGSMLETGDMSRLDLLEGFAGFIKSLKHEHLNKRLCSVTFHTPIDPLSFGALVKDELSDPDPFPEIHYRNADRFYRVPDIKELTDEKGAMGLELDENSHILVLGGAQGITPILVSRLAELYPCTYHLIGRSAKKYENEAYHALENISEIRQYLLNKEGMKQPREIEKKAREIFKENQIDAAIRRFEAVGAKASYRSVDVRDAKAFRKLISELNEEQITISGVIHAAGILEDKFFNNKELESFERVYGTKVDPLDVIITDLLPNLKLLVMFSSVSSTFGNAGQSDYAAGNSVMDNLALLLAHHHLTLRTIAFNWGPWKGAGMVNESLEQEFRRRGVAFLKLDEGSAFFVNELTRGNCSGVVGLAGSKEGMESLAAAMLH